MSSSACGRGFTRFIIVVPSDWTVNNSVFSRFGAGWGLLPSPSGSRFLHTSRSRVVDTDLPPDLTPRRVTLAKPLRIAPSILSADFGHLADEVSRVEDAGADWIHIDVMDGRFVPNLTIGAPVVRSLRPVTDLPLDCHLMVVDPDHLVDAFADAGANYLTVHVEATTHLQRTLSAIRARGMKAGVSLNPHTPESSISYVMDDVDLVLVMSVNPGYGGQSFLPSVLPKIARLREMIDATGRDIALQVDGGIQPGTASRVCKAGADVLVAGSSIFTRDDYAKAIAALRKDAS